MEKLERVYVVPLGKAYEKPRIKRAKIASKLLRSFISRHMKVDESSVLISSSLNNAVWASGIKKPPRRLKVAASRDEEGIVRVALVEENEEKERAAEKAKARAERKKAASEKKPKPAKEEKENPAAKKDGATGKNEKEV